VLAQYGAASGSLLRLARGSLGLGRGATLWSVLALLTSLLLASFASASELLTTLLVEAAGVLLLFTLRAVRSRRD